jgi:glycosyltransferase involved in cell wall biosynthesis
LPNFTPVESESDTRKYLGKFYRPDEKIILFVGRASYEKGIFVLLDAVRYIKHNCRIVIITKGPLLEKIEKKVFSMSKNVELIPGLPYDKTKEYYARAIAVVIPSVWLENFCLVGLEAYANMKPVVASKIGGIQDWLVDNKTGYFFKMGDSKDLALKIDAILSNLENSEQMGYEGYRRVSEYYNRDLYLGRLVEIYKRTIEKFNNR